MERLKTTLEEKGDYLEAAVRDEAQEIKDHLEVVHQSIDKLSSSAENHQTGGKYDDGDCYCRCYLTAIIIFISVNFSTFNYQHTR